MITCKCGPNTYKVKKGTPKKVPAKKVAATKKVPRSAMSKEQRQAVKEATRKALKAANANAHPCKCTTST